MQRLLFYFFALFVLFFACKQANTDTQNSVSNTTTTTNNTNNSTVPNTPVAESSPTLAPTPPANIPEEKDKGYKQVKQAPKSELYYPKEYTKMGVNQFSGSTVENNIFLENNKDKFGRRVKLNCPASYEEVLNFYTKSLSQNGWFKNADMDQSGGDEDIKYFSTNYKKDDFTLGFVLLKTGPNSAVVTKILKEN